MARARASLAIESPSDEELDPSLLDTMAASGELAGGVELELELRGADGERVELEADANSIPTELIQVLCPAG